MKKLNILLIIVLVIVALILILTKKADEQPAPENTPTEEQDTLATYSSDAFSFSYPNYGEVSTEDGAYYFGGTASGIQPGVRITSSTTGSFRDDFNGDGPAAMVAVAEIPIEQTTCLYRPFGEYETLAVGVTDMVTDQGDVFKKQIIKTTNPSSVDPETGHPTEGYQASNEVEACVAIGSTFYHVTIKHSDLIEGTESAVVDSILKSFTF